MDLINPFTKHRLVAVVCVVIGAIAGMASGLARRQVYSSTAVANAGSLNVFAQAVPGFVQAAQTLATTYSRLGTSDVVLSRVSQASGLSVGTLESRIYVVPVADSSVMQITGEGPSASAAERLANEESDALTSYVNGLAKNAHQSDIYLSDIQSLNAQIARIDSEITSLKERGDAASTATASRLTGLSVKISTLNVRLQADESLYESAQANSTGSDTMTPISRASSSSSDRASGVERYLLAGVVGGLLVALLIGLVLEDRRTRLAVG